MMQPAAGVCTEPIPAKQSIALIDQSMRGTSHSTGIDLDPQVFAFWKSNGNNARLLKTCMIDRCC